MTQLPAGTLCPQCSDVLPDGGVCPTCAAGSVAPERRVVTLLFADLVGYTRLCSGLDVEQVYLLVRPLMNALRKACEDLGGVVPVIEGDGFMAVFGAQDAHDDDPQRAVYAAAQMQRLVEERRASYGEGLGGLRVGVNVGEVLVAPSWERAGFSVSGDPVNVASRLSGLAVEGQVLVGEPLTTLVGSPQLFGPVRTEQVRNRDEAVAFAELLWRELSWRSLGRRVSSSLPYAVRAVDADLREAATGGQARHLLGEPGAGKTRALAELAGRAGSRVLLVTAPSFVGPGVGAQLAQQLLGTLDADGLAVPAAHRRALTAAAGRSTGSSEVDTDAAVSEAVANALAATGATAVLVDDGHLLGPRDRALVQRLVGTRPPGTGLVVASRSDDAPDLGLDALRLDPLEEQATRSLVDALLPGAPERLVRLLVQRSGGNPLYLEQAAQLLVDDGTVEVGPRGCVLRRPLAPFADVPIGMRLFVASRLDLLDDRSREVLSVAAVVGEPIDLDLLRHLAGGPEDVGDVVEALIGRGLLGWERDRSLRFRHQVVRDVAYERMLRSRRVALHLVASEWYSVLPVSGLLAAEAAHLEAVIALGEDDCELVRRAVAVLGQWALSTMDEATGAAVEVLERAEALVAAHPRCEADLLPLLVAKASALERLTLPHEADVASAVALDAARRRGDEDLLAEALLTRAAVEVLHTPALAPSVLDEALQLLERRGDEAGLARLRWQRAWREVDGGLDIPLALTERAHHVGVMTGDQRLAAGAALDLAMQLPARDLDEAARWERAAAAVLREHDVVAPAKLAYARAYRESVRHEPALELAAALDLQRAGNAAALGRYEHYGRLFALEALTDLGRLEDAEALLDVVLADAEDRPVLTFVVNVGCREVALRARQGRVAEADAALTRVRALLQDDAAYYEAALLDAEGVALLERGHFDAAHTALDRAHALDVDIDQPALGLRVQLRRMVAALSAGRQVPLVDTRQLRVTARGMGAPTIAALASRWFELHDALRAHNDHFLDLPEAPDLPEARALDREITVLRAGDPDGLLDAAREWSTLGSVVWTARALLWHSELTGTEHPEADELLRVLQSPEGLAEAFRAQVRGLRG